MNKMKLLGYEYIEFISNDHVPPCDCAHLLDGFKFIQTNQRLFPPTG